MTVHQIKRVIKIACTVVVLGIVTWLIWGYFNYARPTDYESFRQGGSFQKTSDFIPIEEEREVLDGMVLAARNESLALYVSLSTSEIALLDRESGKVFYSNPQGRQDDPRANGINKDLLASQLYIKYFNSERLEKEMNNYTDAIKYDQFKIETIQDGIRVVYTLGDLSKGIEAMPKFITPERLEEKLLSKVDDRSARTLNKYYVESEKKPGYLEMRKQVEEARIVLGKMLDAFEEAGYTEEDLAVDNAAAEYVSDIMKIHFVIPVDYQLVDNQLKVTVNTEEILTEGDARIGTLQLLNFFGAGSHKDEGYLFVPSGSGALIDFNNGKNHHDYYYEKVYGFDPVTMSRFSTQVSEPVRLPVYGIKSNDQAFLATIVSGDAIAAIKADVSGRINSYNHVSPVFVLRDNELLSMFGATGINADLPLVEEKGYQGDLTLMFSFLQGDQANYSGMASDFRERLIEEGLLEPRQEQALPFYMDVIGVIEKKSFIMGVPYRKKQVMTSTQDALNIADIMMAEGAKNIRLRYMGWFNDGYYHDVARGIDLIGKLGETSDLHDFDREIHERDGQLFMDVAFAEVSKTSKGYSEIFESSRYLAGVSVFKAPYHPSMMRMYTFYEDDFMRVVSPSAITRHVDGFAKDFNELNLSGLALRDLGDILSSDKKIKAPVDREWSKNINSAMIDQLAGTTSNLLVAGGNYYAWSHATDIVDLPMSSNQYYILDRDVPFVQIALHGSVNYGPSPLNLTSVGDPDLYLLKLIETASAPRYVFTKESSSEFVKTPFQTYYATDYLNWYEKAGETYAKVSVALSDVLNEKISRHTYLNNEVVKVEYENGINIYINYSDSDFTYEDVLIPARGYKKEGEISGDQ